jgi:hypothetical protein
MMNGLNWFWIGLGGTVPALTGFLIALPFWRGRQSILGNIAGAAIIFGAAFALIFREHAELDRVVRACLDAGTYCWPQPSAFTRYAIYAFVALGEVIALFSISLVIEDRFRRRDYSPEWR